MSDLKKWFPFRFFRNGSRPTTLPNDGNSSLSVTGMRDEMDRIFERLWNNPFAAIESQDRWFGDYSQTEFMPRLDVTDDDNNLRVTIEAPGVDPKDFDIELSDGVMTIRGEKRREETRTDEGCYRLERSYGSFQRIVPLPSEIDTTRCEAKFDKGIVTIKLPKTEKAKKQTVHVAVKA